MWSDPRPALCGAEEHEPGWALWGFTSTDLDRIGWEGCRLVAGRLVETTHEAAQQS